MKAFQIAGKNVIFADNQWRLVYSLWLHTDTVHDQLYIKHHHLLHIVIEDLGSLQTLLAATAASPGVLLERPGHKREEKEILDGGDCCEREDGEEIFPSDKL